MSGIRLLLVLWGLFWISVSFISCQNGKEEPLRLAVASNMQYAMEALTKQFKEETGISCDLIISSSGKLTAQIIEGAPYDVFLSADMQYPQRIFEAGLAVDVPAIYAYGNLVLWTMTDLDMTDLSVLKSSAVKRLAIANPKTAPYGKAAIELLESYGMEEDMERKLVYGESISQVNQFVMTQAAELGFTALSVVKSPQLVERGHWLKIDNTLHQSLAQGIILLKGNDTKIKQTKLFNDFLFSLDARKLLKDFGYSVSESNTRKD